MKIIATLLLTLITLGAFSQKIPDRELIESEIKDPASQFYYPRLMKRFEKSDSTLNRDDYFHLYYGYVFQENYKPLLKTNYSDSINMVFLNRRASTGDELSRVERYAKAVLTVEPFNLRDINLLAYCYSQFGYTEKAKEAMNKVRMIEETILSTGTGLTAASPIHVIYQEHAQDILGLMGIDAGRTVLISNSVEFITNKKPNRGDPKGYYFNYSEIYLKNPDYIKDATQPKRKLDINPVPREKYTIIK